MPIHTSPFPTTHDTIGTSTLSYPVQVPSSPPTLQLHRDSDNDRTSPSGENNQLTAAGSNGIATLDIDKRLSQYTIDWNKFPGGSKDKIEDVFEDEDQGPEFGGPEDFTLNLEKYLNGMTSPVDRKHREDDPDSEEEVLPDYSPSPSPRPRHHHSQVEGEESEFGPPVDMSTPSHLMRRKNYGSGKEETRLEDIEESVFSSPEKGDSPSKHDKEGGMEESRTFTTVLREIEDLHEQRRDRDEKIRENEKQLASAREEIENLRAELQLKDSLLSEANNRRAEEDALREQLKILKQKADEEAASNEDDAKEIMKLQEELKDAREEISKRDEALEDSNSELQLRQKNTEIDDLKAQIDEKELQSADADEELADMQRQYDTLKDRIESLETRNSPLEEKNILLEKELAKVRSEVALQRNAVLTLAVDLSIEIEGKDYAEVIRILQQQLKEMKKSSQDKGKSTQIEEELQSKLSEAQSVLQRSATEKEVAETEWKRSKDLLAETRSLITTIEGENIRLIARIQELNSNLTKAREEIDRLKEQHRHELASINSVRQLPVQASITSSETQALREAHQLEIQNLREINNNSINDLRTSYNDSIQHLRSMLSTSEKRATELHNQLSTSQSTISTQSNEIAALKSKVQQLQSTLSLKEETSAEMDKMLAKSIEKREREWERRTELLLRERDKMGKALMWAWGEKEVGKTSSDRADRAKKPEGSASAAAATGDMSATEEKSTGNPRQGYRYKYVVRL
ncbi:spindle pole body associated protein SnaD, putative [Talaromyces stipitatus ATCC 10500]|uniref:Spindle pole body associated protein SnaD, putative n=1 Tax=Talaromyces stipitatus (strain ATCC 10500 / CBS 375.48 / QM 6759 / NRRL 1006) TaxID=441959 RepID=B8M9L8_TALSN|nr:spindle pole body associated protein SnaD, putative [Talaromyces stipitatus ATCC 10500]EED18020.1 spindle pole body associated protein SnaD, putative [Talaromyces stipitatus ATCC 10500]